MHNQPKFIPLRSTSFFADGRSARAQVPGTVARSQDDPGNYFNTGLRDGGEGDTLPMPVTMDLLSRGQERFNVYCSPCHSRVGNGKGMIVERGYYNATSLHSTRLRDAPLGHFFQVMKNGLGAMPNYSAEITPADRWAIAAYIRALQLSQHATEADAPAAAGVQTLHRIEESEGLSEGFLDYWSAPIAARPVPVAPTVEVATKIEAAAPTTPADAKVTAGVEKPATAKVVAPNSSDAPPPAKLVPVAGDAAAGKQVFLRNCAVCHQPTLAGLPPMIPSLIGIVGRVGTERINTVVHNGIPEGKPAMPAFTNLPDKDFEDLLAYLKKGP